MLRIAPAIAIAILVGPILFGLAATILPAAGVFPALGGEALSLEPARRLLAQPGLWRSCAISLATGLITTAISLTLVMTFVAGWSNTRLFGSLQHLVSPLLSVPHAAAAFGLAFLIAPSGWIMRLVSPELTGFASPPDWLILHDPLGLAMIAGLVVKEVPFLFLVTLSAMPQTLPRRYSQAAMSLGYGKTAAFIFVVWPRIYRQIRLAVFAVIAYASSVVDVALILGPTNPAPLAVRVLGWMHDPDLSMRFDASAGALLQLALTLLAFAIWLVLERLFGAIRDGLAMSGLRFRADRALRAAAAALIAVCATAVFLGLTILALWSVAGLWPFADALPSQLTMRTWQRQIGNLAGPFWTTVSVGLAATAISLVVALACLEREARTGRAGGSWAIMLLYLPLIVPQVSFVFGLQLLLLSVGVGASWLAVVFAHVIFVLPYLFLSIADPWRAWDHRFGQVAGAAGSGPDRIFWRIRLPMLLRSALVAAAVGFAVSVGQYLPTVLIGAGRWPTVTTEAVALAAGGDRRVIGVFAFIQMVLPFVGFALAAAIPAIIFANRRDLRAAA